MRPLCFYGLQECSPFIFRARMRCLSASRSPDQQASRILGLPHLSGSNQFWGSAYYFSCEASSVLEARSEDGLHLRLRQHFTSILCSTDCVVITRTTKFGTARSEVGIHDLSYRNTSSFASFINFNVFFHYKPSIRQALCSCYRRPVEHFPVSPAFASALSFFVSLSKKFTYHQQSFSV